MPRHTVSVAVEAKDLITNRILSHLGTNVKRECCAGCHVGAFSFRSDAGAAIGHQLPRDNECFNSKA